MNSVKERRIGVILSYSAIALSVVTGILYTPIMLRLMGKSEYGLYGTVLSFVGLLSLLDAGFSSSYIKFYSKYKSENREDKIKSFNSLFFTVFFIISIVALIIGTFFSFNANLIFDKGLTDEEYSKAGIMMFLLTLSVSLGFATSIFSCYISAQEKFVFLKGTGLLNTIFTVCINLIVLYFGYGAVGLIVVQLASNILLKSVYIYVCIKKLNLKFSFSTMEKSLFKQVFTFSGLIAINMVVDKVNQGIDSVLLGRYCGTAAVAVYSVASNLNSSFTTLSTAISGVFTPHIHNLVNSYEFDSFEQRKALTQFFVKVGRIQFMLLCFVASGFVFFGRPFIRIWAGEGYEQSYIIALILIIPSIIPLSQNVGIEIQRAFNRHHYRAYIYGSMAILNLILSIFLCQKYEGIGSAIGTAIACILANIIIMNIVYDKRININIIDYWKNVLRTLLGMIIPFIVGILIMNFADLSSVANLIIFILIYSAVFGVCVYFLSFNDYEKSLVKNILKKFKRRQTNG